MMYDIYHCQKCDHYSIVESGPYSYCTCGSTLLKKVDMISAQQVEDVTRELQENNKEVY